MIIQLVISLNGGRATDSCPSSRAFPKVFKINWPDREPEAQLESNS